MASLEQVPPIPTLQEGPYPLHRFLGFDKDRHIASLCLRDPLDVREMPPNGNTHISANCVRGVKKVCLFIRGDTTGGVDDRSYTPGDAI